MMDLQFLEGLIKALDESSLDSIEIERGGTRIRLSKTAPPATMQTVSAPVPAAASAHAAAAPAAGDAAAPAKPAAPSRLIDVKSPMVGTFYRSPAPDAPSYVERGARVGKGDTLCIIEAMKLMNEMESEFDGTIAEICVENAVPVEYGQVLFRIDPGA
jgi:acetyl-CoA carboxylase biotin carboxyl carrier protein